MTMGTRRTARLLMLSVFLGTTVSCALRAPVTGRPPASRIVLLQKDLIAKLSGAQEIRPGVKLANRATPENKQEARNYLAALLQQLGMKVLRQPYSAEGENVYAVLSCGRPEAETVVLGAHYDTVRNSPGANDNATGVAVVAAAAQEMVRTKNRSRDLIFVFFDEEERGLRGSRAFAQMLKEQECPVHSAHTIDQMGWDQDHDLAIELERPYDGAVTIYTRATELLRVSIPILTTPESGSDHTAFRNLGYKAVGITEEYRNKDTTPFIHRPGDSFETVDFDYLASTTRLVVEVMKLLVRS